ncbi:hypothetical protein EJ08DRAFT_123024 [Tothia fuscella]|uniref:Glycosyltransferase 2-like domain-containing protein n=1 Tax=Tothia fuscella TaxID=1048955 RepID=A0A9P4U136_9PEZI|nr:hypothetical protein EJ08DRAFT_123024 [Tothia fuscella]
MGFLGKKKSPEVSVSEVKPADFPTPPPIPGSASNNASPRVSSESSRQASRKSTRLTYTNFNDDTRYNAMVRYLYGRVTASQWISPTTGEGECAGVLIRKTRGVYTTAPNPVHPDLLAACLKLNAQVAFTMRTETVEIILSTLEPFQTDLLMTDGSQLQVLNSLTDISTTNLKRFQYSCLLRHERMLLIWHDDLQEILPHAIQLEERLLSLIWGSNASPFAVPFGALPSPIATRSFSRPASSYNGTTQFGGSTDKLPITATDEMFDGDEEKGEPAPESLDRPVYVTSSIFAGLGICLVIVLAFGFAASKLVTETMVDGGMIRLALAAAIPFLMIVGLFFVVTIFTNIFQVLGPIGGIQSNSRYYSGKKPSLRRAYADGFEPPHVTIQLPVYKEGLEGVIMPTVKSLKQAISHYESHGGTASIFVNDDGMQLIDAEEARARVDFYYDNNIGWVARPPHNKDGFVRKGKFKKASNMNFALNIANKVEDYLQAMMDEKIKTNGHDIVDDQELDDMYKIALDRVLEEDPRASAAGNIRMGEIILIIDSDTRVPVDCLLYGAAEMYLSPEVAIIQQSIGIMQVVGDYFENGMKYFQDLVYTAINFNVGNGEVPPFVGHNAFLRWEAVQSVGVDDPDGYVAYWSEAHVSEDFDIALRLQTAGFITRVANYHNNEFKEGVSLTIYDEIARWEKYSYGCTEIMFHPMKRWFHKSPFTPLFRKFLFSNMILSSKFTILAYMTSYFAISSGGLLTLGNYFLIGWFNGQIDKFYIQSWNILIACLVVFNLAGPICLAMLRYRLGEKGLMASLVENFKWLPMFLIFFAGLSFHLNCAILSYLISVDRQWGATAKEKENSNFFKEIPKIFGKFKYMYILILLLVGGMVYLGFFAPRGWEIRTLTAVFPLAYMVTCHALVPFLLNPSIMIFSY